jgi:hypothetical protein
MLILLGLPVMEASFALVLIQCRGGNKYVVPAHASSTVSFVQLRGLLYVVHRFVV